MAPTTALQEKVITIRGQPENCINACREILKVMKADAENKGKPRYKLNKINLFFAYLLIKLTQFNHN